MGITTFDEATRPGGTGLAEIEPEEADYVTRDDVNIAILREIAKIRFRERLPLIMAGVARNLMAAGVDFSRADYSKLSDVTDADIDLIYEDLF